MTYQDRSQDFLPTAQYESVIEVDFDSFEPGHDPEYVRNGTVPESLPSRYRRTLLVDEPRRLYNAMSFLTWKTGLCFNTHVTLTASGLGFVDYREFLAGMPQWHKEMNRCLFDGRRRMAERGRQDRQGRRVTRRDLDRVDHPHYWIAVVEYARNHGVHVHVLCVVPKHAARAFEEKTWAWWRMKSPGTVQQNGIAFRIKHPSYARGRYERQVELFRYIVKTTDEYAIIRGQKDPIWTAREIFKPYPNDCTPAQIEAGQLCGITHRLSESEQQLVGFESRYAAGRFDEVYSGWEIGECERREAWREQRLLLETLQI